jgi:hypothetical protein
MTPQLPKHCTVAWTKQDPFGVELAEVTLTNDALRAIGVAIGTDPVPYRLDYNLETLSEFVTARLAIETRGHGWRRRLDLRRDESGVWTAATESEGEAPFPLPGHDLRSLTAALDCDLGLSPLTNSMPVLRHDLLDSGAPIELRVAWVSVPDLAVSASSQRYTHLHSEGDRHILRFDDETGFTADITFDNDGLVLDYPGLARRL